MGPVVISSAVQIGGADAFLGFEVIHIMMLTVLKHQMFKQVSKTTFTRLFVFRPDMVPDVYRNNRNFMILMDS
jgi:hypothetical protein